MKRNVDLTENGMFTTPEEPSGLFKLLLDAIMVKKPWDFERKFTQITSETQDSRLFRTRSLFAVGNKKERENWKRNREYDAGRICDRCGQNIGKKPWARKRCNCYSMTYTPHIQWNFEL